MPPELQHLPTTVAQVVQHAAEAREAAKGVQSWENVTEAEERLGALVEQLADAVDGLGRIMGHVLVNHAELRRGIAGAVLPAWAADLGVAQTDKGKAAAARATALTANELRAVSLSGSDQRPFCPPNGGRCDHMPGTCTEGCLRERTRTTGREAVSLADLDVTGKVLEGPPDRVAEELKQGYVQVSRNWEEYIAVTEPMRAGLAGAGEALCPETDGMCEHASECRKPRGCWLRHARIAGEPEGRTTGLHRDSMG